MEIDRQPLRKYLKYIPKQFTNWYQRDGPKNRQPSQMLRQLTDDLTQLTLLKTPKV